MANRTGRNRLEIPGASKVMDQLKMEIAQELGISNYDKIDKGDLPARVHGKIGGLMVRRLIELAEQQMAQNPQSFQQAMSTNTANDADKQDVQTYVNQYDQTHDGAILSQEQSSEQQLH